MGIRSPGNSVLVGGGFRRPENSQSPNRLTHPLTYKPTRLSASERVAHQTATGSSRGPHHPKESAAPNPSPNNYGPAERSAMGIFTALTLSSAQGKLRYEFCRGGASVVCAQARAKARNSCRSSTTDYCHKAKC